MVCDGDGGGDDSSSSSSIVRLWYLSRYLVGFGGWCTARSPIFPPSTLLAGRSKNWREARRFVAGRQDLKFNSTWSYRRISMVRTKYTCRAEPLDSKGSIQRDGQATTTTLNHHLLVIVKFNPNPRPFSSNEGSFY